MLTRVLTAADASDFRALRIRALREHPEAFGRTPEEVQPVAAIVECGRGVRAGGEMWLCELHPIRQLQGSVAEFTHPRTGEPVRVAAFPHDTAEYVGAGMRAGFSLVEMGEWRDPGAPRAAAPRLLSLQFRLATS